MNALNITLFSKLMQQLLALFQRVLCHLLLPGVSCLVIVSWSAEVEALPLYTARSGRTCDNCHTDPTKWKNPALKDRKCTLSCQGCHVNPTGGGLRTVSGRFFGQATLPMFYATHRGYKDWKRHLIKYIGKLETDRKNRVADPAVGTPIGGSAKMAFDQGRYAGLNADPLLLFGLDVRFASWVSDELKLFPMQLDAHVALHPVKHLTFMATGGILARSGGVDQTFLGRAFFGLKEAFVMLHELPYLAYIKAGRFLPNFGTNTDDHTSPIRRDFELDGGVLHSRVTGVELGINPNYPYLYVSVFRPNQRHSPTQLSAGEQPPFFGVDGWGMAASAGWRDLGWQLGASTMVRRRAIADGGNTTSYSLQWGFNPWFYNDHIPLTFVGEASFGTRQRENSTTEAWQLAIYQRIDYLLFNGLNLLFKYDYSDPDLEVAGDHSHRFSAGVDWIALPGLGVRAQGRVSLQANGQLGVDGLFYLRGWW